MGEGEHGHFKRTFGANLRHTLTDNLPALKKAFKTTPEGYFGTKGSNTSIRRIASSNPLATAEKFFKVATKGGTRKNLDNAPPGMEAVVMKDGSLITKRVRSSSDGSPVVEITVSKAAKGAVKDQKIHFTKEK